MSAVEKINLEVDRIVSTMSSIILLKVIDDMSTAVVKGHRFFPECQYCHELAKYTRMKIQEWKMLRVVKNGYYGIKHDTTAFDSYRTLYRMQADIAMQKRIKDKLKVL